MYVVEKFVGGVCEGKAGWRRVNPGGVVACGLSGMST